MSSATASGVSTVTVHYLLIGPPAVSASVQPSGVAVVTVTPVVDGVHYTTAVSRGTSAVSVGADGMLAVSLESDGVAQVSVGVAMRWVVSAVANGVGNCAVIYTPDLFGDGDGAGLYDPDAVVPIALAPPIKIGMDLRGACSVIPPPPVLG